MYPYFFKNGELLPVEQATIPLSSIEYAYGFGVYETIRAVKGKVYFLEEHVHRLLQSAQIIQLEHPFAYKEIVQWIQELVEKNQVDVSNIKMLLIGARKKENAILTIQCLAPLFPDRKLYKQGASAITVHAQRAFPHAKTLNMLPSYLAYREAKKHGCYDALLINHNGYITEGTRTNFLTIKNKTIFSPPDADILLGVTRHHVIEVAQQNGYIVKEQNISFDELPLYDGAFLTSTSSKIMPLKKIDDFEYPEISLDLKNLITAFNEYLNSYS